MENFSVNNNTMGNRDDFLKGIPNVSYLNDNEAEK